MVEDNALVLTDHFFDECAEGQIRFVIELYDGKAVELWATKDHDSVVTGKADSVDLSAFTDVVRRRGIRTLCSSFWPTAPCVAWGRQPLPPAVPRPGRRCVRSSTIWRELLIRPARQNLAMWPKEPGTPPWWYGVWKTKSFQPRVRPLRLSTF